VPLGDSVARLGATSLLLLRQRLELVSLDVEEELLRDGLLLAGALVAALLGALFLAALGALVVVLFWDTARIAALLVVTLAYGAAAAFAVWRLARAWRDKPRFLAGTLAELGTDGDRLRGGLAP
jgi:uncharacterized membrane protein YqjE